MSDLAKTAKLIDEIQGKLQDVAVSVYKEQCAMRRISRSCIERCATFVVDADSYLCDIESCVAELRSTISLFEEEIARWKKQRGNA